MDRRKFSRYQQAVKCRGCGRLTTWSEVHGYGGLDLCRTCFEQATLDNAHWDGEHADPVAECRLCQKKEANRG